MSQTMREQFEKAVIERMKESGFLEVEIRVECLSRHGDDYHDPSISAYWHFYKQSRADLVVELPDDEEIPNSGLLSKSAVLESLEAAGVTVAS